MTFGGGDLPPLVALVQADIQGFLDKSAVVSARLDELTSLDTSTSITADIAEFEAKMAAVKEQLATLQDGVSVLITPEADLAKFALVQETYHEMWEQGNLFDIDVGIPPDEYAKLMAEIAAIKAEFAGIDENAIGKSLLFGLPALTGDLARLAGGGAAAGGGGAGVGGGLLSRLLWGGGSGGIFGLGRGLAGFGSLGSLAGFGPEHLATVGLGLAGSATGGLIGGGILAAGSLGTAAVGAGTDLAGIGQAVGDTKSTLTNLNALSAAQQEYGKNSAQAAAAQSTLNQQLQGFNQIAVGAVVQTAETTQGWVKMFDAATGAAEKTGAEVLTQAMKVGEEFLPTIGKFAAENTSIIQKDIQPLFSWMGGQGLQIFTDLENKFQGELPTSLNALTQGIELFARTIDLASQSTGGLMSHLSDFLTRMNGADFDTWSAKVEKLIGDFRLWDDFIKILFKDIADLFSKDVGTASGIVTTLTNALNSLHEWINSTTGSAQLRTVFEVHKEQILELLPVIGNLIDVYGKLFLNVAPDAVRIMDALVKVLGDFLTIIEKLGPLGDYALAIVLISSKLGLMVPLVKAAFATDVMQNFIGSFQRTTATVTTESAVIDSEMGGIALAGDTAASSIGGVATALGALAAAAAVPIVVTITVDEILKLTNQIPDSQKGSGFLGLGNINWNPLTAVKNAFDALTNTASGNLSPNSYPAGYGPVPAGILPGTSPTGAPYVTSPITGGRPASNVAALGAGEIPTGNVTPPTGPTTASQAAAAQVPAAVTQGMATLARLVADVHSTSLATLRSAVVQVHEKGFSSLIAQLDAIHSTASLKLASQLENVAKEAGKNQTAEVKTIESAEAAARVAATVAANTAMTNAVEKAATDLANSAAQLASDASKLATDSASGQVTGMSDYAAILTDQGNAQIQAIQDGATIAADQLAETGLTGTALQAAQAQVALDIQKQTDDAKINADTIALAQQKATDDAQIAAATQHADQVALQQDQLVAQATAKADTVAINDQARVNAASIAYAVAEAGQNVKQQQTDLKALNDATDEQTNDQNYYGGLLTSALNTQTQQNSNAQGALQQIVNSSQLLEQALQDILSGDTTAAGIAEAKLEAIVGGLTSVASATTAAATTPAATAPIQVTVVTQIDGQQVALTTTPLIRQELLRSTARQTQNVLGGSAGRLTPSR